MYKFDLIVLVATFFLLTMFSCDVKGQSASRSRVGGECAYKTYRGTAEIVSITQRSDSADGYEIRFSFLAEEPVQEEFARVDGREYLLLLSNGSYPKADFLVTYGIAVG